MGAHTAMLSSLLDKSASGAIAKLPETISDGANSYKVTVVGDFAFEGSPNITSTGLAGNKSITYVGSGAFKNCIGLISTGLDGNDMIKTMMGDHGGVYTGVFMGCTSLTRTGLEGNHTLTHIGGTFWGCTSLLSTGLKDNRTITYVGGNAFRNCTSLKSADLGSDRISRVWENAFKDCSGLTATGLEDNHSITDIGPSAFENCVNLGRASDVTGATNTGDLVINQPSDGTRMTIEARAFLGTSYNSLYLLCNGQASGPDVAPDGISPSAIKKVYVQSSWLGSITWRNYSVAEGSLVIMNPPILSMNAKRVPGTSDAASVELQIAQSFTGQINDASGHMIKRFSVNKNPSNPTEVVKLNTDRNTGLAPGSETLSVRNVSPGSFIFPAGSRARPYNSVSSSGKSCGLSAVAYKVAFDPAGGTGAMPDQPMTYGVEAPLEQCGFTRGHYAFVCWDAGAGGRSYADKERVSNLSDLEGATVTLRAIWKSTVSLELMISSRMAGTGGGSPLAGAGYALSATSDVADEIYDVYTDPEMHHRVESWPQMSASDGNLRLYGVSPGTYHLLNLSAPTGYQVCPDAHVFTVGDDGSVSVDGVPYKPAAGVIALTMDFLPAPVLPGTGVNSAGHPESVAVLVALAAGALAAPLVRRRS
ncbi:leucine-rich repeat protein [Coriobacterium glomerans]|uniref:leucine-rich repeat protein n=1 Tax=Coriobacterium glomerans TaxID=33871 RepID=UPI00155B002E|nr:leucine-rich repeat protein [Coriobacterium glomerans]